MTETEGSVNSIYHVFYVIIKRISAVGIYFIAGPKTALMMLRVPVNAFRRSLFSDIVPEA